MKCSNYLNHYTQKLKYLVFGFLMMITVTHTYGQAFVGDSWNKTKTNGAGVIAMAYVETPGFVYRDDAGNITGICVDIMRDFANYVYKSKGIKLTTNFVGNGDSFKEMYHSVKHGKDGVFGLGNITITEARKKEIRFSPPIITNMAILVTQHSVPTLRDISAIGKTFNGLTAYTAKGTLNEKRILALKRQYHPELKIAHVPSSPATLEKVLSDKNSFAYLDVAFYIDAVKKKRPIKRHPIGDKGSEEFGLIMPRTSDWKPIVDEFFASGGGYTNSIEYKKILAKHLGTTGVRLIQSLP